MFIGTNINNQYLPVPEPNKGLQNERYATYIYLFPTRQAVFYVFGIAPKMANIINITCSFSFFSLRQKSDVNLRKDTEASIFISCRQFC